MIPFPWLKAAPYLVIGVLLILLAGVSRLYLDERDALVIEQTRFDSFVATVAEKGRSALERKKQVEADQKKALAQVEKDYEDRIPEIRRDAVAQYRAAHPARLRDQPSQGAGRSAVRDDGAGLALDDGAAEKCVHDEAFIEDAAEDARKVEAWQAWCILNQCPIAAEVL